MLPTMVAENSVNDIKAGRDAACRVSGLPCLSGGDGVCGVSTAGCLPPSAGFSAAPFKDCDCTPVVIRIPIPKINAKIRAGNIFLISPNFRYCEKKATARCGLSKSKGKSRHLPRERHSCHRLWHVEGEFPLVRRVLAGQPRRYIVPVPPVIARGSKLP